MWLRGGVLDIWHEKADILRLIEIMTVLSNNYSKICKPYKNKLVHPLVNSKYNPDYCVGKGL